jgi:hypothetical protein
MNMMRKGQVQGVVKGNISGQVTFIASLFGGVISAEQKQAFTFIISSQHFCNTAVCPTFRGVRLCCDGDNSGGESVTHAQPFSTYSLLWFQEQLEASGCLGLFSPEAFGNIFEGTQPKNRMRPADSLMDTLASTSDNCIV